MALNEMAVSLLRMGFPALQQTVNGWPIIFFDSPGGSQVHGSVIEAIQRYFVTTNSNAHGAFSFSARTDQVTYEARKALADFLNAPRPEEIMFGPNMTTIAFRISQAIRQTLRPGDEILVTRLDHDANISPWLAHPSNTYWGISFLFLELVPPKHLSLISIHFESLCEFLPYNSI